MTLQQLAERQRLLVVQFDAAANFYPRVVASPINQPPRTEVDEGEVVDVEQLYGQGRQPLLYEKQTPFWVGLDAYEKRKFMKHPWRNQQEVMVGGALLLIFVRP